MTTAAESPALELAGAEAPPPYADAVTLDFLGRPICEGATHRATRNCTRLADFRLLRDGESSSSGYACVTHVGQVAQTANGGESGPGYEFRLIPIRTRE
ncbi:hypothetical protein AB0J01_41295 [Streptomyces sp. NPDC050204]|uniref:hypothetical protein n=1 Tax=Streptomyces sp. NPDC050204 TaxID=3155514 RepID=UPI0034390451